MNDDVRVIHDDCLCVLPTLGAGSVDAVVTDPPYGMNWDTTIARFTGGHNSARRLAGRHDDRVILEDDRPFDPSPWLDFPRVILWGSNHYAARLPVGTTLVWVKRNEDAFGLFLSDAEIGWMKGGHGVYLYKDLSMNAVASNRVHPSQKPVRLMMWAMDRAGIPQGATVLDPYAGSGSTGVACLKSGRKCILIEKDERYIEIIHRRLESAATPLFREP
jgi:DNA modification methylase